MRLRVRPADIASLMVLWGLGAQGFGLYTVADSTGWALLIVGTEIGLMGLVGVLRAR